MPTLIGEKRSGNITTRIGKNGIIIREQSHYYTVQADSKWQDRSAIILCPGLPQYGVVYTDGLSVKSINADRHPDDAWRWDVVVTGSSEVEEDQESKNNSSGTTSSDPTTWIPIASVRFEQYPEVFREDVNGKRWANSARKPFETGLTIDRKVAVVSFSQFEPISTKLEDLMDRGDTINSIVYRNKAIKTLRLSIDSATIGTYSGIRCWRVDYTMRYKPDNWILKQIDCGWGYYVGTKFTPFKFSEDDGGEAYLGLLDNAGGKIANEQTDDPEIIEFEAYEAIDFNGFLRVLFV